MSGSECSKSDGAADRNWGPWFSPESSLLVRRLVKGAVHACLILGTRPEGVRATVVILHTVYAPGFFCVGGCGVVWWLDGWVGRRNERTARVQQKSEAEHCLEERNELEEGLSERVALMKRSQTTRRKKDRRER